MGVVCKVTSRDIYREDSGGMIGPSWGWWWMGWEVFQFEICPEGRADKLPYALGVK